jgi:hypothetical protein
MQLDQKLWQIVVGNSSRVPLAVTPSNTTMKKQTDEIARLENYAIWFRRETLRRWAEYLDKQIKKSGIVSNQSQIELETAKYGKRFTVSRQRISQIQAAKNPDAVMKDHSLMNVETVIGIAAALDLPLEQAMEAAGYRMALCAAIPKPSLSYRRLKKQRVPANLIGARYWLAEQYGL